MKQVIAAAAAMLLGILALALLFLLRESAPALPQIEPNPAGIAQSSISNVRIPRNSLLSPDKTRVWLNAVLFREKSQDVTILIDLKTNQSLCLSKGAQPLGWAGANKTLFFSEKIKTNLEKLTAQYLRGEELSAVETSFFVFDQASMKMALLTTVRAQTALSYASISPDGKWLAASWGVERTHEISLVDGAVSPKVEEKYLWAPAFVDADTYYFIGESAVQSRKVGASASERASQPLLQEIRDAIRQKGTPGLEVCGRFNGEVYLVDHVQDQRADRLLRLDSRTRLSAQVALMEPSRSMPSFNPSGTKMVYQGNPFNRTQENVYLQDVAENSQARMIVSGVSGQISEANPQFLSESEILFVHRGTELRSCRLEDLTPVLHWPQSILP